MGILKRRACRVLLACTTILLLGVSLGVGEEPVYGKAVLKDGRSFEGEITEGVEVVQVKMKVGVVKFKRDEVDRIEKVERKPESSGLIHTGRFSLVGRWAQGWEEYRQEDSGMIFVLMPKPELTRLMEDFRAAQQTGAQNRQDTTPRPPGTLNAKVGLQCFSDEDYLCVVDLDRPSKWTKVQVVVNGQYRVQASRRYYLLSDRPDGLRKIPLQHLVDAQGRSFGTKNFRGIDSVKIEADQGEWCGPLGEGE